MDWRHSRENVLYRVLHAAILACIGLFIPFLGISVVTWKNLLVLFVVLALFAGVNLLPARGKGLCLLFSILCLGVLTAVTGLQEIRVFLQDNLPLVQTAVVTAAAFFVQIPLERFKFLKYCLAFVCADGMLYCLLAQISLTHMGVVFALFYVVVVYVEWLQEHWKKKRSGSLKGQMLWLSPFLGVYLLLMAIMPAPEKPYDWQWAKDIYAQVKEVFLEVSQNIMRGGHEDFDMALSGFSDDVELGSDVRENDREVMRIQSQNTLATNVYLIGKIYDTFDGRQWQQEYHGGEKERFLDTMETLYAVRRLDDSYQRDYLKETLIKIKYEYFNTGYVFAPLKVKSITGSGSALNYSFEGGDLLLEKRKGYGTEYDVVYYQLNLGEELFVQLLEARKESDEALWETIAKGYEGRIEQKITPETVDAHRQMIYENYMDEVMLSKEVESYLSEITKDAETDLERLQAIERELNSYTYTRTPGELPDKVTNEGEFLDYFLLESRQGYCTYFATAFVLLARAEGIPARYAQGFCVPMEGSREAAVLSNMAHAWPEVYIDDVGWIPFEPTPGYERLRYTSWKVSLRDILPSQNVGEVWDEEVEETPVRTEEETEAEGGSADRGPEDGSGAKRLWRVLAFYIPVILVVFALVLVLGNLLGLYRYRRMSPNERLKLEVRRNLRMLSWLGLKKEEQETLQELRERGMLMLGMKTFCFIEIYEDIVYGGKRVREEMLEEVRKERQQFWRLIRKEKKWKYVFYRIRMFLVRYW